MTFKPWSLLAVALLIACGGNDRVASSQLSSAKSATEASDQLNLADLPSVPSGPIAPGRYRVLGPGFPGETRAGGWPETVVVTLPEGWWADSRQRGGGLFGTDGELDNPVEVTLGLGTVDAVLVDPCAENRLSARNQADPPVRPSVDELASALASMLGLEETALTEVTLDGFDGIRVTATIPAQSCDFASLWVTESAGELWTGTVMAGWHYELWILDVVGHRFVVNAGYSLAAPGRLRSELRRVVNSIEIEP